MTVIAMTREIGSLGTEVAAGVATELGLTIIDSEIAVQNSAETLGLEHSTVQRYLDGSASIFERWKINKRQLSRYTSEQILKLAQQDNVLIRGWGAAALFKGISQALSVRVCAPTSFRERIIKERIGGKDTDAIRDEIKRYDAARAQTVRAAFNVDREDARHYHIVLNTGRLSIDACVKAVCQLAGDAQFNDDASTRLALADKLLEIKITAALRERIGVAMAAVTVSAKNGTIILGGTTSDGTLRGRAEQLSQAFDGVRAIENRISSVPNYGRF